jgi:hypothetical protein
VHPVSLTIHTVISLGRDCLHDEWAYWHQRGKLVHIHIICRNRDALIDIDFPPQAQLPMRPRKGDTTRLQNKDAEAFILYALLHPTDSSISIFSSSLALASWDKQEQVKVL